MQTIFDTVLPFFALIFCGYGARRFRVLNEASVAGVNSFVFYFALPTFLFDLISASPLTEVVNTSFIAAYLSAGLPVFAVAAILGRTLFKVRAGETALLGAAAVLGNTGYMGLPLISTAFGEEAAIPIVLGLTLEVTLLIPLTIAIIETGREEGGQWLRTIRSVGKALVRNPLIISIFAGALVSASNFPLPTPITTFTGLLGGTAGPCALFALGATLAGYPLSSGMSEVSYMTTFKLLVHPTAMWLTTTQLFDVDPLWATVATLGAALPVAANVFIVARQYDTYVDRTSSAILVSTTASILTVSAILTILNGAT